MTTGADRPPYGTRHRKFSPLRPHRSIRPISREIPSRPGPRGSGQSPSETRRGPWADTARPRTSRPRATGRANLFSMHAPRVGMPPAPTTRHPVGSVRAPGLRSGATLSSKRHSSRHAERAGAADLTQEAGRRKAGVREGERGVAGVEGVPDPQLGKKMTDPDAAAEG